MTSYFVNVYQLFIIDFLCPDEFKSMYTYLNGYFQS